MNSKELVEKITSCDLFPIRVEGSTEKDESEGLPFIGDFEEFVKAAKVLNTKVIFVFAKILQDTDFIYEVDGALYDEDDGFDEDIDEDFDNEDDNEQPKEIYLPTVLSSISEYKKYIGKECAFKLSLRVGESILDFYLYESWWNDFLKLREEAIGKIEEDEYRMIQKIEESRKKLEEERRSKEKELIGRLKKLINDKDFVRLPTQVAMKASALDKIPELSELDDTKFTREIQELNARIIAKGYRRR
ncbi:MAG: hypothetical protein ONB46_02215 [candidate division KSB1 bacterium]|nr:hypothetical protein [candidate division KSB1 bacterium]MDZ7364483.1 hypothetical protein [candidate division KSB1 bacterium]MDZ7402855.1 hypothetical protein [candidate division KSB1 bacterium]